jgi:hypothetical protein
MANQRLVVLIDESFVNVEVLQVSVIDAGDSYLPVLRVTD